MEKEKPSKKKMFAKNFTASCLSLFIGFSVSHPLDTLRVRQAISGSKFSDVALNLIRNEGVFALYKGYFIPILATLPIQIVSSTISNFYQEYMQVRGYPFTIT